MQYILQPEVPGELGEHTIMDTNVHPPIIRHLHFTFQGWLGDELIECFPCFLVSDRLKQYLSRNALTGFVFSECEIDFSEEFSLLYPLANVPAFHWMKISNNESDDFLINSSLNLQVSEKAWVILREVNISHCDVIILK